MPLTPEEEVAYASRARRDGVRVAGTGDFGILSESARALTELSETELQFLQYLITHAPIINGKHTHLQILDACAGDGTASLTLFNHLAENITNVRLLVIYAELQLKLRKQLQVNFRNSHRNFAAMVWGWNFLRAHKTTRMPWRTNGIYLRNALHWLSDQYQQVLFDAGQSLESGGIFYIDTTTPFNCLHICDEHDLVVEGDWNAVTEQLTQRDFISRARRPGGNIRGGFTPKFFERVLPKAGFTIHVLRPYRNQLYKNGLGDEYPENIEVLAVKR